MKEILCIDNIKTIEKSSLGKLLKGLLFIVFLLFHLVLFSQNSDSAKINRLFKQCDLSFQHKQYEKCRDFAEQILEIDDSNCNAYMILGKVYANIPKDYLAGIMEEESEYRMIFCLAVDMLEKAKQVDTLCSKIADKEISLYSKYFPILPWGPLDNLYGKEYIINGWINRKTTVRCSN